MAHRTRIHASKQIGFQGSPGSGKTRQAIALTALFARRFHGRAAEFRGQPLPTWAYRLIRAWRNNPHVTGDAPRALPIAVSTPMRVTTTWEREFAGAYPEAEVVIIGTFRDVDTWMRRAAESSAPVVVGVFSQSKTRAFSLDWEPALITRTKRTTVSVISARRARCAVPVQDACGITWDIPAGAPLTRKAWENRDPITAFLQGEGIDPDQITTWGTDGTITIGADAYEVAKGEDGLVLLPLHPVTELRVDNKLVGHTSDLPGFAGTLITERTEEPNFYCPDCGARIEVMSKDKQQDGDDEGEMMPVTSRTYFTKKQRTCIVCKAPLWQRRRSDASRRRWAMPTFADWSAAIAQIQEDGELAQFGADSQRRRIARVERDADGDGLMITLGREAPSDFSPYEYALLKYEGLAAIHLADEAHNARGTNTDIARSIHYGFKQAQTYAILSGTISGGMLGGLYHLIYRFWPQFWKRLGLGWNDVEVAMLRYGFVTETVTEHEGDSRRGSGQTDRSISSVPAPGMSAKLIPMLLERIIFIDAEKDLGAFMPDMEEIPDVVDMDDPAIATARRGAKEEVTVAYDQLRAAQQAYAALMNDPGASSHERATAEAEVTEAKEAHRAAEANQKEVDQRADAVDLAAAYDRIASRLDELAEDRIQAAILAKGMLPRWWSTLPCVNPAFTVTRTTRGTWGDLLSEERIFTAPVLAADYRYPLEKRLIEHVTAQLAQGRTVMVYIEQNAVRSTPTRLAEVLAAFAPWTLPNNVDPEDREDAIRAAYEQGKKVFIVPYRRVSEGLNLQFLDTVIWYEMAQNYYHLEQSNLRIRRLGATNLKQVIYLVYRGTVSHKKLIKLGEQSGSASLFAGDTPEGALVQTAGADKTTLAQMSASVEQVDAVELSDDDLKAVFARRSQAANAARKQGRTWAGITDTLPQRLDALRAAWATKAAATLPTIVISAHTPAPVAAHTPAPVAAHTPALVAAPTPKLAFGDLDFIGAVLRKKRRTTRKQGQFEAQFDMFSAAASNHPTPAPGGTAGQLSMF